MRTTEPGLFTLINILACFVVTELESLWTGTIIGPFGINAVSSLANTIVLQAFIDIFAVISKGGRSVTMVTDTAEGALCVSALPITAEMTVLAFIDIFTLVSCC